MSWGSMHTLPGGGGGSGVVTAKPPVATPDAATITCDASASSHHRVQLTAAVGNTRVLAAPANGTDGQVLMVSLTQDATGGRAITTGAGIVFGSDLTSLVLSTAASKTDKVGLQYNQALNVWHVVSFIRGF